jgi:hypothetical protein
MSRRSIHWGRILFEAAMVLPSSPACDAAGSTPEIALSLEWGRHSASGLSSEADQAAPGS